MKKYITSINPQNWVVVISSLVLLTTMVWFGQAYSVRWVILFFIATLLGITLYHASFGFSSAYRIFFLQRQTQGINSHLLLLAIGSVLFAPLLSMGEVFGQSVGGALAPVSTSVAVGAFLFGIGMQLGDGCASGTLYAIGGGSRRMLITLIFFIIGCVLATYHMAFWWGLPSIEPVSLIESFGGVVALLMQIFLLAIIYLLFKRLGKAKQNQTEKSRYWFILGSWPLWVGAISLALLNLATLLTAGHPWSITWGYTLWGGKIAQAMGVDLTGTYFWGSGFQLAALKSSIFDDVTSIMNLGVILGATIAAGLAQRFLPPVRWSVGQVGSAIVGGLLMGYGARLAFGCNIGAFFSGVVSFSLHGWLWILSAFPGAWLGVKLRPFFGFKNS